MTDEEIKILRLMATAGALYVQCADMLDGKSDREDHLAVLGDIEFTVLGDIEFAASAVHDANKTIMARLKAEEEDDE